MADAQAQGDSADAAEADLGEEDSDGFHRHRDSGGQAESAVRRDGPAADDYFRHLGSLGWADCPHRHRGSLGSDDCLPHQD
jgi:hypothetical protein